MNTDKLYAESLANEYAPKDSSKIKELRRLDRQAKMPANVFAYTFGITASLVAGLGMSLAMQVIGGGVGLTVLGIGLGCLGFGAVAVNYPIYRKLLAKGKEKYAFEIVELARKISNQ